MPRAGRPTRVLRALAQHVAATAAELPPAAAPPVGVGEHPLSAKRGAHLVARTDVTEPDAHPHSAISTRDNTPVPLVNSFGVSSVLPGYGVLPKKVTTAAEAAECVRRDGACILTGVQTALSGLDAFKDAALDLPGQLFGERLIATAPPASVGLAGKDNAAEMRAFYTENWGKPVAAIPPWGPNCAHTDGEAYGDRFPPYLFLLFAHQSAEGGENAIVSSQFVVEEMARSGDAELERAAALLRTVPVEQTQHGEGGASGIDCVSPIVQTLPGGRTMIKVATSSQIPATAAQKREAKTAPPMVSETVPVGAALAERAGWDEEEAEERDQWLIDAWKDAVFAATAHAPRFKVLPGEALLVDVSTATVGLGCDCCRDV